MILKQLIYILFIFLFVGCYQTAEKPKLKITDGIYHSDELTKIKVIRGTKPNWQFTINQNKGILSYFGNRENRNYNLFVNLNVEEDFIQVKFDSIISSSYMAISKIKEFKNGEILFEYSLVGDSLVSNSSFLKINSSKNTRTTFYKVPDSVKIEPNVVDQKDYTGFRNIQKYLGRGGIKKKKVLLVPCENGYEYIQQGYDFNPLIEKKLEEHDEIIFIPFPYKKMNGSGYHSVYDKKYCTEILEKTAVDYLIMTKFTGNLLNPFDSIKTWGYETKILNTKTMKQFISIKASGLNSYEEIEKTIIENIGELVSDIKEN